MKDKRYLIHDRDPLFTLEFLELEDACGRWGEVRKASTATAEFNAYAERCVRSINECCLDRTERSGAASVWAAL